MRAIGLSIFQAFVCYALFASEDKNTLIIERGGYHNVVQSRRISTNSTGGTLTITNTYVHLELGVNRLNETGDWIPSNDQIEITTNGAVARGGQHKVTFGSNITDEWPILLQGPDGKSFRSRVLALAYFDAASGNSVIVAEVKGSQGFLVGRNQIAYFDSFDNVSADVVYTYSTGAFEQDILLREAPPTPESFGLSSETSRLEVITEFDSQNAPIRNLGWKRPSRNPGLANMAAPTFWDERLDFGEMQVVGGKAFPLPNDENIRQEVGKSWQVLDNRHFLIEAVEVHAINGQLSVLPRSRAEIRKAEGKIQASAGRHVPKLKERRTTAFSPIKEIEKGRELAARLTSPAYVFDYVTVPSAPSNYRFSGSTTYLVNGLIPFSGTTTFEGGTVIKFAAGGN